MLPAAERAIAVHCEAKGVEAIEVMIGTSHPRGGQRLQVMGYGGALWRRAAAPPSKAARWRHDVPQRSGPPFPIPRRDGRVPARRTSGSIGLDLAFQHDENRHDLVGLLALRLRDRSLLDQQADAAHLQASSRAAPTRRLQCTMAPHWERWPRSDSARMDRGRPGLFSVTARRCSRHASECAPTRRWHRLLRRASCSVSARTAGRQRSE